MTLTTLQEVLAETRHNGWHVELFDTTCYCHEFRSAIAELPNLQADLEAIDPSELTGWRDALTIIALDQFGKVDWEPVLRKWQRYIEGNLRMADRILYYFLRECYCVGSARDIWIKACIGPAVRARDVSLMESLIRVLGSGAARYPELVGTAAELSEYKPLLKNALVKAHLLEVDDPVEENERRTRRIMKQRKAASNLFGAIRRNDVKAIHALLAKNPDFSVRNAEGQTVVEYARSLGRQETARQLEVLQDQG